MNQLGLTLGRALVTAAAVAGAVAVLWAGAGYDFWVWATAVAVVLVATGALANRTWVVAVPFVAAVVWGILLYSWRGDGAQEPTWEFWAMFGLVAAAAFALCLLVGIGMRRAARASQSDDDAKLTAPGRS